MKTQEQIDALKICVDKGHKMEYDYVKKNGYWCDWTRKWCRAKVQLKCPVCGYTTIVRATRAQDKSIKCLNIKAIP